MTTSLGQFEVTKVRMADDLFQEGLLKKDKKAASFVTIGEPDMALHKRRRRHRDRRSPRASTSTTPSRTRSRPAPRPTSPTGWWTTTTTAPTSSSARSSSRGGPKDAFDQWQQGLDDLAKRLAKQSAERTLKIEIDDEAFDRLYGYESHPIPVKAERQQIAVRVVSQFGEESTKVLNVNSSN